MQVEPSINEEVGPLVSAILAEAIGGEAKPRQEVPHPGDPVSCLERGRAPRPIGGRRPQQCAIDAGVEAFLADTDNSNPGGR